MRLADLKVASGHARIQYKPRSVAVTPIHAPQRLSRDLPISEHLTRTFSTVEFAMSLVKQIHGGNPPIVCRVSHLTHWEIDGLR